MAALVTNPILIDPILFSRGSFDTDGVFGTIGVAFGPWLASNGALYAALTDDTTFGVHVFKSTDVGVTWTRLDEANEPQGTVNRFVTVFADNLIYICCSAPNLSTLVVVEFDCGADTYGTTSGVGPSNYRAIQIARIALHSVRILGTIVGGGLYFNDVTSGSWGTQTLVTTSNTNARIGGSIIDGTGAIHLDFTDRPGGVSVPSYIRIDPAGTGSDLTDLRGVDASIGPSTGHPVIYNGDTVVFAFVNDARDAILVFKGTPLSGPIFTAESIAVAPMDCVVDWPITVLDKDGNLVVFWTVLNQATGDPDQQWMRTYDGVAWADAVLFYDAVATPPPHSVATNQQFIHTASGRQSASGQWQIIIALETIEDTPTPGFEHCTGFLLLAGMEVEDYIFPELIRRRSGYFGN